MLTFSSGIGYYGLGVFLPSLEKEFKVSTSLVSLGTTIFFVTGGLVAPFVGRRLDAYGPKTVMLAGIGFFGLGLVGLGAAQEIWQIYLAYAIMSLGFTSMGLITVSSVMATWFRARRGLAIGFAMTGLSVGGVIIVPLTTGLILVFGWRVAAFGLAVLVWAISIPLVMLVMRRHPSDLGLLPDGATQTKETTRSKSEIESGYNWTTAEARRTLSFWAVAIGWLLVYVSQSGVLIHQIRFLTYGTPEQGALSPQAAAFAVSVTALASIGGRLALGSVIDRLERRWVAIAVMLLQASATFGLLFARGNIVIAYISVLAFGLGMGCVVMLQSLIVTDLFGMKAFGAIYGAITIITMVGTAGGPWLASFLFDWSGSYNVAFIIFGVLDILAAFVVSWARPPHLLTNKFPN
jgi:MFS family permease